MAASYEWVWLRGLSERPFTIKVDNGSTALGINNSPVLIASNALGVPTQGAELVGVAIANAAASETDIPVISGFGNIFRVQVKSGTNLNFLDPVQVEADGSVDTLAAGNSCVGVVVNYNPATAGVAEIMANFNTINGAGVNDAATKLPLTGGTLSGNLTFADAVNVIINATTGTKIGTAATQKLGFWNAAPVVQPAGAAQAEVTATSTNGVIAGCTSSAQTTQAEFNALRDECEKASDDARAAIVLANALRTALVDAGLIKGSA